MRQRNSCNLGVFRRGQGFPAGGPTLEVCRLLFWCIVLLSLLCGCQHSAVGSQVSTEVAAADELFRRGEYRSALDRYEQILQVYPDAGDGALFEMGLVHAYAKNPEKDHRRALECFQRLLENYPASPFRKDSQTLILSVTTVAIKDTTIAAQQGQIDALRRQLADTQRELDVQRSSVDELRQKVAAYALRSTPVDKILIEKRDRKLSLLSRGQVVKSYRIALGGNPLGAKARAGDGRTPEGTYTIDSRNRDSRYHRSLHISYPNDRDRRRAREQGVSPGGNIMIHGIGRGLSEVGDAHAEVDWTKGCIAVTDQEIEELYRVVPDGTAVEIRP